MLHNKINVVVQENVTRNILYLRIANSNIRQFSEKLVNLPGKNATIRAPKGHMEHSLGKREVGDTRGKVHKEVN